MPSVCANVSLVETVLPSIKTREGQNLLNSRLTLSNKDPKGTYQRILQFSELVLRAAVETGEAIRNRRYTEFDALVGNYGCQITAASVLKKMQDERLKQEAVAVSEVARSCLENLAATLQSTSYVMPPITLEQLTSNKATVSLSIVEMLKQAQVDLSISTDLADLIRFKILKWINSNEMVGDKEVARTKVEQLYSRVEKISENKKSLELMINAIQLEEAAKAADCIENLAAEISSEDPRASLIQAHLSNQYRRTGKGIVSVPLIYNTEAALKSHQGVVLVKNKLSNCLGPIPDARPQRVYLQMPGEIILDDDAVAELPQDLPIMVLEGRVIDDVVLKQAIVDHGLINIVLSCCADDQQYANIKLDESLQLLDEEARSDIEAYRALNLKSSVYELDHVYCASLEEEQR